MGIVITKKNLQPVILEILEATGWTKSRLGVQLGASRSYISQLITDTRRTGLPQEPRLRALAELYLEHVGDPGGKDVWGPPEAVEVPARGDQIPLPLLDVGTVIQVKTDLQRAQRGAAVLAETLPPALAVGVKDLDAKIGSLIAYLGG